MSAGESFWHEVMPLSQLAPGAARVVKVAGYQVAVFRTEAGDVYAVDNRCPHEGYPLAQGWVKGCVLTCAWHNYKFDLRNGNCLMGDEAVTSFPVQIQGDAIQVEMVPPDPAVEIPKLRVSLGVGLADRRLGQVARDLTRLMGAGASPVDLALEIAAFDAERAEYGTTHALPVAADVLRYREWRNGFEMVLPLMQAADMASEANVRCPVRPVPVAEIPSSSPEDTSEEIRRRVEAEDAMGAEALFRGALASGWNRSQVESCLLHLCTDHFLDFGHPVIYVHKALDLLAEAGWERAGEILPALVHGITLGTREDLLPEWSTFRKHTEGLDWADLARRCSRELEPKRDISWVQEAVREGSEEEMLVALRRAGEEGVSPLALVDAASLAGAARLWRFDPRIDADITVQDDVLDATHRLTFPRSVRAALERWSHPRRLRLAWMACYFVNRGIPLDLPPEEHLDATSLAWQWKGESPLESMVEALRKRDPQGAVAAAGAHLHRGGEGDSLFRLLMEEALGDDTVRPVVVAHRLKTTLAAWDEYRAMASSPHHPLLLLAVVRLGALGVKERRVGRVTHEALRFVVHGKVPKRLT